MKSRYDLVVLGGGTAGLIASLYPARVGARVALVEQAQQPGGDCLFTGCVPSKSLIASARLAYEMRTAGRLGLEPLEPRIDFARVMERIQEVIRQAGVRDDAQHLEAEGVEVIHAFGRFARPGLLEAGGRERVDSRRRRPPRARRGRVAAAADGWRGRRSAARC
jgi:pyruvate/2-oxoglutarate dehydrogenase complex dihydrolipoamide dehydrogenase (E3) component